MSRIALGFKESATATESIKLNVRAVWETSTNGCPRRYHKQSTMKREKQGQITKTKKKKFEKR